MNNYNRHKGETLDILIFAALILASIQIIVLTLTALRGKRAHYFLALLLSVVVISTWNVLTFAGKVPNYQLLDYWLDGSIYWWGPLLFLFVGSFLNQLSITASKVIIHLLPGLALFTFQWPVSLLVNAQIISTEEVSTIRLIFLFGFYIHFAAYFYLTSKLLPKHGELTDKNLTQTQRIDLNWLARLIWLFGAILAFDFCIVSISLITGTSALAFIPYYLSLSALIIAGIGLLSLLRNEEYWLHISNIARPKYQSSAIDPQLGKKLFDELNNLMSRDAPYLDNELKLADLAKLLGVSSHHLSQIINEQGNMNFYDYINAHRAKHAAKLLLEKPEGNITQIAFDSGFNNRVSFGKSFKKQFGATPSTYRAQTPNI